MLGGCLRLAPRGPLRFPLPLTLTSADTSCECFLLGLRGASWSCLAKRQAEAGRLLSADGLDVRVSTCPVGG